MGKITFESDDPAAIEAFEDAIVEAAMDCRMTIGGRCAIESTEECRACPLSGGLRSKRRAQTKG
jgi:hypothetical protein